MSAGGPSDLGFPLVALTIGIVGLPNAGKSTLFNALTKNDVLAANYPFATIEPNVGVVGVPDDAAAAAGRDLRLARRSCPRPSSSSTSPASSAAPREGEGLGNKFLSHIRESAAICQVTRVFRDEDVTHVDGEVNPASDISTIQTELILADLQTRGEGDPAAGEGGQRQQGARPPAVDAAKEAQAALEAGTPIIATEDRPRPDPRAVAADRQALHLRLQLRRRRARRRRPQGSRCSELVAPAEAIFLDAKFESELVELDDDDEAREMLAEMGVDEPGLDVLARVGFDTLGLQTYLTAGPKESRAWTIRKGATAPEAAGVIHTDFQRGFIKAEIVSFDDLVAAGSMPKAKEAGKVRMEGKDYVMADGDVVEFRFNV